MASAAGVPQDDGGKLRARIARDAKIALVVGSLLIVGSVGKYAFDARETLNARGWPQVDGVVIDTSMERRFTYSSVRGRTQQVDIYEPVVNYRYAVDGRPLFSRRVWLNERTWNTEEKANRVLEEYAKGTQVTVRYDPQSPDEAYLVANLPVWHVLILTFVGACMVAWGAAMRRSQATGRPVGRTRDLPPSVAPAPSPSPGPAPPGPAVPTSAAPHPGSPPPETAPTRETLDAVIAELEALARGDLPLEHFARLFPPAPRPDGTYNAPYTEYTPAMDRLWDAFTAAGMQVTSDEYNAWIARGEPPLETLDQIATLHRDELRLRLFVIRRHERFVEGHWADMLTGGVLLAFARRLRELNG